MDTHNFKQLEQRIAQLITAFSQVCEENIQLKQQQLLVQAKLKTLVVRLKNIEGKV